jgi:hypothetical protein
VSCAYIHLHKPLLTTDPSRQFESDSASKGGGDDAAVLDGAEDIANAAGDDGEGLRDMTAEPESTDKSRLIILGGHV